MVDTHTARMFHRRRQGGGESLMTGPAKSVRREGSQAPVLAGGLEDIWWRADRQVAEEVVRTAPGVTSARVHPDRQIRDQADRHP